MINIYDEDLVKELQKYTVFRLINRVSEVLLHKIMQIHRSNIKGKTEKGQKIN